MDYHVEDLQKKINVFGKTIDLLINTKIEITDYDHEPADSGMPVSAWRGAEPSHSESYSVSDWEISDKIIVIATYENSEEVEIELDPKNPEDADQVGCIRRIIKSDLDWKHVDEKLTEYHGG